MLVRMIATSASPEGILHAGQVYDLPRKRAESLLKGGPNGRAYARTEADLTRKDAVEPSRPAVPGSMGEEE